MTPATNSPLSAGKHGTAIGWTHWPDTRGETVVDVTGCDPASPGCGAPLGPGKCYSAVQSGDTGPRGLANHPRYLGVADANGFTGVVRMHPEMLEVPLHHRTRRTYFHNSMSDTLHPKVTDSFIAAHLAVAGWCQWHNFLNCSKRHARLPALLRSAAFAGMVEANYRSRFGPAAPALPWPLPNVAWGLSVEDQERADIRMPYLARSAEHAECLFVSAEPLLGPVSLRRWLTEFRPGQLWVIAGGQSGAGYQPLNLNHARRLRDDCAEFGIPFFFKQVGGRFPSTGGKELDGREHAEFPAMAYREVPPWRTASTR